MIDWKGRTLAELCALFACNTLNKARQLSPSTAQYTVKSILPTSFTDTIQYAEFLCSLFYVP